MKNSEKLMPSENLKPFLKRIYRGLEIWAESPSLISLSWRIFHNRIRQSSNKRPVAITATKKQKAFDFCTMFFPSSLEDWYSVAQWVAIFVGALALALGSRVNARQSTEIARLKKETAEANLKTAELRRTLGDRYITPEESAAFVVAAKQLEKPALIRVVPESFQDHEADMYSRQIMEMLQRAGYKCERILPREWDTTTGSFQRYVMGNQKPFPSIRLEFINAGQWVWQLDALFPMILGTHINPGTPIYPAIVPPDGGILIVGRKPDVELPPP